MKYRHVSGGPAEMGGVDFSGTVHEPLVFDRNGICEVPDDMHEVAQTIAIGLAAGLIRPVKSRPKSSKED